MIPSAHSFQLVADRWARVELVTLPIATRCSRLGGAGIGHRFDLDLGLDLGRLAGVAASAKPRLPVRTTLISAFKRTGTVAVNPAGWPGRQ